MATRTNYTINFASSVRNAINIQRLCFYAYFVFSCFNHDIIYGMIFLNEFGVNNHITCVSFVV